MDCSHGGNMGCDGGDMRLALDYVLKNGLMSEKDYRYEAYDGKCKYVASKVVARISCL